MNWTLGLYGPRAVFLYHQMFQQCLRKLVQALIKKFAAPPDLEVVVRQLWLLYVSQSDIHYEHRRAAKSSQDATQSTEPEDEVLEEDYEHEMAAADNEVLEEENANLLDETQTKKMLKTLSRWPVLSYRHLLVFVYMGCVWLRWPILLSDLQRWSVVGKLPYVALTKDLPTDFLDIISGYKLRNVKVSIYPNCSHLFRLRPLTYNSIQMIPSMPNLYFFCRWYFYAFRVLCNLRLPDSNYAPLVYRATRELMLPSKSQVYVRYMFQCISLI
jgi:hypothetical protein